MKKEIYSKLETDKLIELSTDIEELEHEAIQFLLDELYERKEYNEVYKIAKVLSLKKYRFPNDCFFEYIIQLKNIGIDENEINEKLIEEFKLDERYLKLIYTKLKSDGYENLFMGIPFIIISLGILLILPILQINDPWTIIMGLIISSGMLITGILKTKKGLRQREFKNIN